ncbi:hypothetical protein [Aliarcobacter cryaerophilus]|uniref:hypothetical protein n=1 Tax=Aliarcobacter cryaerophilus TaxID=28198 RepID=UPI0021B4BCA7|nr:hypothetical protein [Aliarcobacter cryaerophilus]MCT7484584.1 hypothetical protein [Aliarcobacter cryaerophilus]
MSDSRKIYFAEIIDKFQESNGEEDRYASFDYCYNYFRNSTADEIEQNMETSCLHLMAFLSSWGMLRGSSFLLEKSVWSYREIILYIINKKRENPESWVLGDYDKIDDSKIDSIVAIYYDIENLLIETNQKSSNQNYSTLITKIMLGVFACIPAFDTNFVKTFNILYKRKFPQSINSSKIEKEKLKGYLKLIIEFYKNNKNCIDAINISTKSFHNIKCNNVALNNTYNRIPPSYKTYKYSIAKIIDMFGFIKGKELLDLKKECHDTYEKEEKKLKETFS